MFHSDILFENQSILTASAIEHPPRFAWGSRSVCPKLHPQLTDRVLFTICTSFMRLSPDVFSLPQTSRGMPVRHIGRTLLSAATAAFLVMWVDASLLAQAQPTPGTTADDQGFQQALRATHRNSLGVEFKAVPGALPLFAAHETRLKDFESFCNETNYPWKETPHFPQTGDHPVVNVNLRDAIAFCAWLTEKERKAGLLNNVQSYRLPTNLEWDAAAGLSVARKENVGISQEVEDQRAFPWGIEWPPPAHSGNFNSAEISGTDDGYVYTSPVGLFGPSQDKLFDLAGNVWEWAWDQEIRAESYGTLRGGSWIYFRKECLRSNYQYHVPADLRAPSVGFRVVFEDKHRSSILLANVAKAARELDAERRKQMANAPVSAADVEAMRKSLDRRTAPSPGVALPDATTLTAAKSGEVFINTLGLHFRPFNDTPSLIGETEVRVRDYELWLKTSGKSWDTKPTFEVKDDHPIMNITWQQARDFCTWLTTRDQEAKLIPPTARYRLPTDAEWSQAVGLKDEQGSDPAAKDRKNEVDFPWGREVIPPVRSANLNTVKLSGYQDNYSYTAPVSSFSPNEKHLFDLAGNVSEWCEDAWPGNADERVVRGSSWLSSEKSDLLSSARLHSPATFTGTNIGFRMVLDLGKP